MAAPSIRSFGNTQATGTTFSVTAPSSIVNGDLMLSFQVGVAFDPTTPSGWTQLGSTLTWNTSNKLRIYYKTASSEPGSYTFNGSSLNRSHVWIYAISGAKIPPVTLSINSGISSTTLTATGVTTTSSDALMMGFFTISNDQTITPSQGSGDGTLQSGSLVLSTEVCHQAQTTAGASGNYTATVGTAINFGAALVAIYPPPITYTASSALTTGHVSLAGTAVFAVSYGRGTSSLTIGHTALAAAATYAAGTDTAVADLTVGHVVLTSFTTFTPITYTASAAVAVGHVSLASAAYLLIGFQTNQSGLSGVYSPVTGVGQGGGFRVQNDISGYNVYIGIESLPDLNASPAVFSTTLPINIATTPPLTGVKTHYVIVRKQDHYGLESQNQFPTIIIIDVNGDLVRSKLLAPEPFQLFEREGEMISVMAGYAGYGTDTDPATSWKIWSGTSPPNPLVDVPVLVTGVTGKVFGVAIGPYAPGTVYVTLGLFRAADSALSPTVQGSILIHDDPEKVVPVASGFQI